MRIFLKAILIVGFAITITYVLWQKYLFTFQRVSIYSLNAEAAFYYSYFVRLIQSSSIEAYLNSIISDTRIQTVGSINSFITLPILFEVVIGFVFKGLRTLFPIDPLQYYIVSTYLFISLSVCILGYMLHTIKKNYLGFAVILLFLLLNDRFLKVGMRENLALFPLLICVVCIFSVMNRNSNKLLLILLFIIALSISIGTWQFSQFAVIGMLGILIVFSVVNILEKRIGTIAFLGLLIIGLRMMVITFNIEALKNFGKGLFGHESFDKVLYIYCSGLNFQPPRTYLQIGLYILTTLLLILITSHIKTKEKKSGYFLIGTVFIFGIFAITAQRFYILFVPACLIFGSLFANRGEKLALTVLCIYIVLSTQNQLKTIQNISHKKDMVSWLINTCETPMVIAGPMEITSQLLIDSRFSIVNPVFYETKYSHKANKDVYGVYGFTDSKKYHVTLSNYKTTHLILDRSMCESNTCNVSPFYPVESNKKLCDVLVTQSTPYFQLQYYNDQYAVFRVAR